MKTKLGILAKACLLLVAAGGAVASSHREAPGTAGSPRVDGTDFYMFRSYEGVDSAGAGGRTDYVTLIANYQPLQAPYGGPNYFQLDQNALYEIHIDNNGDAKEDLTFQFRFKNELKGKTLLIGSPAADVAIPLVQFGPVANPNDANLNVNESYEVKVVRGLRRSATDVKALFKTSGGSATFEKPVDNIGSKTIADYPAYAAKHVHTVTIPGCPSGKDQGKVFVGQRQEGFAVNLGPVFDLVNADLGNLTNPALINAAGPGVVQKSNVTTIALEVHKDCLTAAGSTDKVIGGWTTASLRQARLLNGMPGSGNNNASKQGGAWTQVSRLGNPLVNELVIGLPDKDKFNASQPKDDTQFLTYVSNPTLPRVLEIAFPGTAIAPTNFPRTDLLTTFLTGITTINKPATPTPSEMLRLDTSKAPVPFAQQNRLGIVGNALAGGTDQAGFPNGRRPKDDVVDIALVAVTGGLCMLNGDTNALGLNGVPGQPTLTSACKPSSVPLGNTSLKIHDAIDQAVVPFLPGFPYLNTPNSGAQ